jgi:hypothetical protein
VDIETGNAAGFEHNFIDMLCFFIYESKLYCF